MKTISLKNAFKLFLFLLILFSAKAFSYTKLPDEASSSGSGSRFSTVKKATIVKTHSNNYSDVYKGNAAQSKNTKRFKK